MTNLNKIVPSVLCCLFLNIVGYALLVRYTNWQIGFAIFLIHWAINLECSIKYKKGL